MYKLIYVGIISTVIAFGGPSALRDYNVFSKNGVNLQGSRVDGRIAGLGDINLADYMVGGSLTPNRQRCDLTTTGNLNFTRGSIPQGALCVAGNTFLSLVAPVPAGFLYKEDLYRTYSEAESYSSYLAGMHSTSVYAAPGQALMMRGSEWNYNAFSLSASDLSRINEINIEVPNGSVVIVNVYGSQASFRAASINLRGTTPERVVFNFPQATSIDLANVNWKGSLLAPYAALSFSNGRLDGSVAVAYASGNGYYGNHPFTP